MDKVKVTKRQYFEALRAIVEGVEAVGEYSADEVLEFIDTQVAQLDAKAEKAREKAAEKKAEGDEVRAKVLAVVTDEPQTADEITAAVGDEEISRAKVIARLTQLVNSGDIVKEPVKVDGAKKMVYKRA